MNYLAIELLQLDTKGRDEKNDSFHARFFSIFHFVAPVNHLIFSSWYNLTNIVATDYTIIHTIRKCTIILQRNKTENLQGSRENIGEFMYWKRTKASLYFSRMFSEGKFKPVAVNRLEILLQQHVQKMFDVILTITAWFPQCEYFRVKTLVFENFIQWIFYKL